MLRQQRAKDWECGFHCRFSRGPRVSRPVTLGFRVNRGGRRLCSAFRRKAGAHGISQLRPTSCSTRCSIINISHIAHTISRSPAATVTKLRSPHHFSTSRTRSARLVRRANLRVSRVLDASDNGAHGMLPLVAPYAIFVYGA